MPRTLISFIGTGSLNKSNEAVREYRTATYTFEGKEIGRDSFIASVLYNHLKIDRLILIGTVKSMWEEVYQKFSSERGIEIDEEYYLQLSDWADKSGYKTSLDSFDLSKLIDVLGEDSQVRLIPYGLNEQEQWSIFNVLTDVFKTLETREEIYLDITHAFRSLPIFSMTALMYLQDVLQKSVEIKGVYYGMLETSSEFNGQTPIVDLSLILKLQDWIKGAYSFLNFGKGYLIADLLEDKTEGKLLRSFSDSLSLNYLADIEKKIHQFRSLAKKVEQPIARMILPPVLLDFTNRLMHSKTQAEFQLELSIWHREQKSFSSAYIVFVESMITYACEQEGWDWQKINDRNKAKSRLKSYAKYKALRRSYKNCNSIRNNIAHNLRGTQQEKNADISELVKFQNQFKKYITPCS